MKIAGLQKLTLIDYPGKVACTIFLFGCNFKCGFCHNPELVISNKAPAGFDEDYILDFLKERRKYLDAVCITGGETLIHPELPEFLKKIKNLDYTVKIDTNGSNSNLLLLTINKKLVDYIAMDIKSDKDNYNIITNSNVDINNIENSIKIISDSGLNYEFRTTVIKGYHDKEKMIEIAKWINNITRKKPVKYAIQNFTPRKDGLLDESFENIEPFTDNELEELKENVKDYFEDIIIRN